MMSYLGEFLWHFGTEFAIALILLVLTPFLHPWVRAIRQSIKEFRKPRERPEFTTHTSEIIATTIPIFSTRFLEFHKKIVGRSFAIAAFAIALILLPISFLVETDVFVPLFFVGFMIFGFVGAWLQNYLGCTSFSASTLLLPHRGYDSFDGELITWVSDRSLFIAQARGFLFRIKLPSPAQFVVVKTPTAHVIRIQNLDIQKLYLIQIPIIFIAFFPIHFLETLARTMNELLAKSVLDSPSFAQNPTIPALDPARAT
jgi:hypothetical protein